MLRYRFLLTSFINPIILLKREKKLVKKSYINFGQYGNGTEILVSWSYDLRFTFIYCGTKVKACLRKIVVDVFARTTSDDVVLLANLLGKILCEYVLSFVLQYIYIFYPIYLKCVKYFLHALFHSNSLSLTHFIHITLTYSLSLI